MPLFDHLGELRRRMVIIFVSLAIAATVLYLATPQLIDFLIYPIREFLPKDNPLNFFTPLSGFSVRFRVAVYSAVVVCSPLILWEILAFFLPALKPNERKWVLPTLIIGVILFILGLIFCYTTILRPAFLWMHDQSLAVGAIVPNAQEYIKIILLFEIAFGLAFELPLITFYLIIFNFVSYTTLRKQWRTVYVTLLIISAMVTPDASPVTMAFMFAALLSLYEISLFVARIVLAKRIQRLAEEDALYEEDML